LRIIHACWHSDHLSKVKNALQGNQLTPSFLQASAIKGNWEYESIEILLKGIEQKLPKEEFFHDKDGHERTSMRIQWWKTPKDLTFEEYGLGATFSNQSIPSAWSNNFYYAPLDVPVFIGHYWLKSEVPTLQSPSVCCLDYSVAKGGHLVAYRWNKGESLSNKNYVSV